MANWDRTARWAVLAALTCGGVALGACSEDEAATPDAGGGTTGGSTTGGGDAAATTACGKYGGPTAIDSIVQTDLVGKLAGDCRISKHFTSLPAAQLTHVKECLSLQVQEVFGCPGVKYEGSKDKSGAACRDMKKAHEGLGLTKGDFDALIEDTVAVLTAKGVAQADITAVAPILTSQKMKDDIIGPGRQADACNSQRATACTAGTSCDKACDRAGGPRAVDSVVQTNLVAKLAGDCRISRHFTELPAAQLTHVKECLSTQVQELFGCAGATYAGSKDKAGVACRSMAAAHNGLGITQPDFDALIEDTVATLQAAGVQQSDINAAAPVLTSTQMKADVVGNPDAGCNSKPTTGCDAGTTCN